MRTLLLLSPLLPLAGGCAYEAPLADQAALNVISGTLVFAGDETPKTALVLVFDAANPPPPAGTGRPLTFSTVSADAWTGDGAAGVKSAPFSVPYLRDTTATQGLADGYLLTAIVDQDENFHPLIQSLGGSTWGDWLGSHVASLAAPVPVPIFVQGGEHLQEVTVLVGSRVSVQRPVFTITGDATISRETGAASLDPTKVQTFRLQSSSAHATYADGLTLSLDGPCPLEPSATCDASLAACRCDRDEAAPWETGFPVWFVDRMCEVLDGEQIVGHEPCDGGDGKHDPYPAPLQAANGLKDTWPRVYLEWMGEPTDEGTFAADLRPFEHEGKVLPERWVGESFPLALELNFLGAAGIAPDGAPFLPFPAREISVTWSPVVRHYHAGGQFAVDPANGPFDLYDLRCHPGDDGELPAALPVCQQTGEVSPDDLPTGAWRITVVTHTGQTWVLPNELGLESLAAAVGLPPMTSDDTDFDAAAQGRVLTIE